MKACHLRQFRQSGGVHRVSTKILRSIGDIFDVDYAPLPAQDIYIRVLPGGLLSYLRFTLVVGFLCVVILKKQHISNCIGIGVYDSPGRDRGWSHSCFQ